MKTLIIDNYDSFTYNLSQYISELGGNPIVYKHDEIDVEKITDINPTHIVISPGPGTVEKPEDFGICEEIILTFAEKVPTLGVCLGHQGIAKAFGGSIKPSSQIMHGKQSQIEHEGKGILEGVKNPFTAMRYHSLCVDEKKIPAEIHITAHVKDEGTIMAIQHYKYPLFGVQFHPESFGTPEGKKILQNFLDFSLT